MGIMDDFSAGHQRLKERIHNFRIPLSRPGRIAMSIVYFSIPVVGGHYLMQWAQERAQVNLTDAGVLPKPGETPTRSKTHEQNAAIKKQLEEIRSKR
ncbi:unnamed protein product [Ectocarpus sp. CCAP 1310/34]|nr:unnamed protein product [Ectocarpus sp. CCAP 1310/34]